MSDKNRIIQTACSLAESGFVAPWEMSSMLKTLKENGIGREDFVKVLSENPNEAILNKVVKWIPRYLFNDLEFSNCVKREDRKKSIWNKYNDYFKQDPEVKQRLSLGLYYSWEFLEEYLNR